jgi:hypothetical protein
MNFKARGRLQVNPEMAAKVKIEPLRFETGVAGSCECRIGAISAHIGDVRIRAAVPFLKPRRKLPLMATVGGFRIRLKPVDIRCGTDGIEIAGILGLDGIRSEVDARLACQLEGDAEGQLPMKSGRLHFDLEESE